MPFSYSSINWLTYYKKLGFSKIRHIFFVIFVSEEIILIALILG